MNLSIKSKGGKICGFIVIFITITIAIFYIGQYTERKSLENEFSRIRQIRLNNEKYPLVSRLIGTEIPESTKFNIYSDLKYQIKALVDNKIATTPLSHFSFYFRDLNTGLWFGVNENEEYIPASLFKLPIAMTYYGDSLEDKDLLNEQYVYTEAISNKLNTKEGLEESELIIGNSYSVSVLIEKMLIDSDNGAKILLTENINTQTLNDFFNLIQLSKPSENNYYISPKEYALFLRILYNGSYLGVKKSQNLLAVLSKATFKEGIRKSIPEDIPVVHKFGSINLINKSTNKKQTGFHDCGIVYYPERPFILCFMTSGDDQLTLSNTVEKVTSITINYVQKNN